MFLLYWICKAKAQKFTNDLGRWFFVMYIFIIPVYKKAIGIAASHESIKKFST